jgi:hypothetical protein
VLSIRTGRQRSRSSIPGRAKRLFSSPKRPDHLWNSVDPPQNWYRDQFTLVETARQSPQSSAEVKNGGNIPPILHTSSWRCAELLNFKVSFNISEFRIWSSSYHITYSDKLLPTLQRNVSTSVLFNGDGIFFRNVFTNLPECTVS